jgi:hypothetical protein
MTERLVASNIYCRRGLGLVLTLRVAIFVCAAIISAPTMACAEPLFFDCQGTVAYSLLGSQRYSSDFSTQIMFDAERGIVEVPGGGRGLASATNEYWTRQSDWMQVGATSEMRKTVKECTTLRISETNYSYTVTSDIRTSRLLKN